MKQKVIGKVSAWRTGCGAGGGPVDSESGELACELGCLSYCDLGCHHGGGGGAPQGQRGPGPLLPRVVTDRWA